jgi:hypothetical protein
MMPLLLSCFAKTFLSCRFCFAANSGPALGDSQDQGRTIQYSIVGSRRRRKCPPGRTTANG